jgi:hypothetical protein
VGIGQGQDAKKYGRPTKIVVRWPPTVSFPPHFLHAPMFLGLQ